MMGYACQRIYAPESMAEWISKQMGAGATSRAGHHIVLGPRVGRHHVWSDAQRIEGETPIDSMLRT